MRNGRNNLFVFLAALGGLAAAISPARAQVTNAVTPSGFTAYVFNNVALNPTLTLYRGVTYVFAMNALGHPFYIKTSISGSTTDQYTNGVVNNGGDTTPVIFTVPAAAPNQLFYNCGSHSVFGMHGTLNISNAPAPPSGQIVLISLSPTGVTMKSLGSSSWTAVPEYNSNLTSKTWATVPSFNNVFANGTNTTTFNRLDAICGPNVFLRIHSKFP